MAKQMQKAQPELKIFIPHRLKYKDEMYEEVCELLYDAEETGDLPPWDDLSLKPDVDYLDRDGKPKDKDALLALAAVRIRDSHVIVLVDRPAADYGDYLREEVRIAKRKGIPLVILPDPEGRGPCDLLDELDVPFTEADWTPEDIAEAIDEAVQ